MLRQPDADVNLADAATALEVRLVMWSQEQLAHPAAQRGMEAASLSLVLEDREGALVHADHRVEFVRDRREVRRRERVEGAQSLGIVVPEADVALELGQQRSHASALRASGHQGSSSQRRRRLSSVGCGLFWRGNVLGRSDCLSMHG